MLLLSKFDMVALSPCERETCARHLWNRYLFFSTSFFANACFFNALLNTWNKQVFRTKLWKYQYWIFFSSRSQSPNTLKCHSFLLFSFFSSFFPFFPFCSQGKKRRKRKRRRGKEKKSVILTHPGTDTIGGQDLGYPTLSTYPGKEAPQSVVDRQPRRRLHGFADKAKELAENLADARVWTLTSVLLTAWTDDFGCVTRDIKRSNLSVSFFQGGYGGFCQCTIS